MHRNKLLRLLSQYNPLGEEEQYKQRMIAFIQANENCFERSLEAGHITGSAWLVNADNSKALLMHHNKLDKWLQLGGHCDGDSDVLSVALKEAREESGVDEIEPVYHTIFDLDIHLIPANATERQHYHYDVRFLLRMTGTREVVGNKESKALQWIGKDDKQLPTAELSVLRMFSKWLNA